MAKFDTIQAFKIDHGLDVPVIKPTNEDLLLYYICAYEHEYLQMCVVSVMSMLKHTNMRDYHVSVYLDQRLLRFTADVDFLRRAGVQIHVVDGFVPKFQVPFREENKRFKRHLCIDCDAFATPHYPVFKTLVHIEAPMACRMAFHTGMTLEEQLKVRQPQSRRMSKMPPEDYLKVIRMFMGNMNINVSTLKSLAWCFGFFSMYMPSLLVGRAWAYTARFVNQFLNTTCDETLMMLCYLQDPTLVQSLEGYRLFVGRECYTKAALSKGAIVHPIGLFDNDIPKNLDILRYATGGLNPLPFENWKDVV